MTWQIELVGEDMDTAELQKLARSCGYAVTTDADGKPCLMGAPFDALSDCNDVREHARETLTILNGLAMLRYPDHRSVRLGDAVFRIRPGGRRDIILSVPGIEGRARVSVDSIVINADGTKQSTSAVDLNAQRYHRINSDPNLLRVVEALTGELTWQRLRVAFERLTAVVGKSGGDYAAFWRLGYAPEVEVRRLKANIQDPRISGLDAVHGVPRGPVPAVAPMTVREGAALVASLLKTYVDRP